MPLHVKRSPLVHINQFAIKGEPGTGLENGGKGEFSCRNCEYFKNGDECHQKDMMAKSKRPKHPNGSVEVSPKWCCEYVDRVGKFFLKD